MTAHVEHMTKNQPSPVNAKHAAFILAVCMPLMFLGVGATVAVPLGPEESVSCTVQEVRYSRSSRTVVTTCGTYAVSENVGSLVVNEAYDFVVVPHLFETRVISAERW